MRDFERLCLLVVVPIRKKAVRMRMRSVDFLLLPMSMSLRHQVLMIEGLRKPSLNAEEVARLTAEDCTLSQVYKGLQTGSTASWQGIHFQPYKSRVQELSTHRGCVLWGTRVVIPTEASEEWLTLLHSNHLGMTTMKRFGRSQL